MSEQKFHIGHQIERVLGQRRMMKCVLADKLGVSMSTAVHLRNRETIDVNLLQKIGNVLKYNFFKHYPIEEEKIEEPNKDKIIEEQQAKISELEKQMEEMKGLEMTYMKRGYDDLRQAHEMLLASLKPKMSMRSVKVRRKSFNNEDSMFG